MTAYDVEPGDQVHPGNPVTVDRYTTGARINHWITAASLVLLALVRSRAVPPEALLPHRPVRRRTDRRARSIRGSASCCSSPSSGCSSASGGPICGRAEDGTWLARIREVLAGHDDNLPEIGNYNAGQKFVFWSMSFLIIVLISSGVVIWDQYFAHYTTHRAEADRRAGAFGLRGGRSFASGSCTSTRRSGCAAPSGAMTRGRVTGGWAWRYHRKWLKELVTGKA